jgi:hypothetical protein
MNTVGLFAGRGDVVLGYLFALVVGMWIGWQLRNAILKITRKTK